MTTIDRLRALGAEATPGPWASTTHGAAGLDDQIEEVRGSLVAANERYEQDHYLATDLSWVDAGPGRVALVGNGARGPDNAALIAAARNALPALLDVAEAAQAFMAADVGYYRDAPFLVNLRLDVQRTNALRDALARLEEQR